MALAEDDLEQHGLRFWGLRALIALALAGLVAGLVWLLSELMSKPSGRARQVAKISLVPDTPPPPPPPPKPEREQETPKEQKAAQEVPKPQVAPPQPSEVLKMEGQGSDSGIAGVQAGSVAEDYRGQTIGGAGPGGMGYAWYGGLVQRDVQQHLQRDPKLRGTEYKATVRLWLSPAGEVQRVEIAGSTGSGDADEMLRVSLSEMPALKDPPPSDMPQPIRLRVTSRI